MDIQWSALLGFIGAATAALATAVTFVKFRQDSDSLRAAERITDLLAAAKGMPAADVRLLVAVRNDHAVRWALGHMGNTFHGWRRASQALYAASILSTAIVAVVVLTDPNILDGAGWMLYLPGVGFFLLAAGLWQLRRKWRDDLVNRERKRRGVSASLRE